jgi:hypothetical protein
VIIARAVFRMLAGTEASQHALRGIGP